MNGSHIALRNGFLNTYYLSQGSDSINLVFLHGWTINSSYWEHQLEYFGQQYGVYAMDLAGFGKSVAQRSEYTIEEYAQDVLAFIDELNLSNVILIGHSMSGNVILEAALAGNPRVIGLIGIDNFLFVDGAPPGMDAQMQGFVAGLKQDYPTTVVGFLRHVLVKPSTPSEVLQRLEMDFTSANPEIAINVFEHLLQHSKKTSDQLEQLPFVLGLLVSDQSPLNREGLDRRCGNGYELALIEDTGHYPMVEKPQRFNELLQTLLERILP